MFLSKLGEFFAQKSLGKPSRITAFRRLSNTERRGLILEKIPSRRGPGQNPPRGWRRLSRGYPNFCCNARILWLGYLEPSSMVVPRDETKSIALVLWMTI